MQEDQQFASKLQDLLESKVNVQSQQAPDHHPHEQYSLNPNISLDNVNNSLALYPRHSMQKFIPLSKNMLSEDVYHRSSSEREFSQVEQNQEIHHIQNNKIQSNEIMKGEEEWLVDQLGLNSFISTKKITENTKNVLRNFGNAQNQYALYNKKAMNIVQGEIKRPEKFYDWVRSLKLENFQGFKKAWLQNQDENKIFKRVYKKICWIFYVETAIPYVLSSRMKDEKTKMSHLKYIYRFLEGIKQPEDFTYFKKVEK